VDPNFFTFYFILRKWREWMWKTGFGSSKHCTAFDQHTKSTISKHCSVSTWFWCTTSFF